MAAVKSKIAPSVEIKTTVVDNTASTSAPESMAAQFSNTLHEALENKELPTGRRVLVSLAAGVILTAVSGYFAMPLVATLVAYAATLTTSAFLIFMVQFLSYAIALIAALFVGGRAQSLILNGSIDRAYAAVGGYIGSMFSRKAEKAAAS